MGYHSVFIPDLPITTTLQEIQETLIETLMEAQGCYKEASDRHNRSLPTFHVGGNVWLSTKNLKVHVLSAKFNQKFV